jgi:hypothetical protein
LERSVDRTESTLHETAAAASAGVGAGTGAEAVASGTASATTTTAAGRSRSQEHSRAEAEGGHAKAAPLAGHAICELELLSWGCSSGHRGVCSLRKANRAAGCPRGGGAERDGRRQLRAQEAAVVEEDEEMEREDERGVAKRPDLNKLDVPEWAEATAAHRAPSRDGDSEPQAERND